MTTVTLAELQAGDKIAIKIPRNGFGYDPTPIYYQIMTIERVTSSLLICGRYRFRKSDGQLMGDRYSKAEVATDELVALNAEQVAMKLRYHTAVGELYALFNTPLHRLQLTVDQLEALAVCWVAIRDGVKDGELSS